MSKYLNIYLKDFKEDKWTLLDDYQGDIRDSFSDVLSNHTNRDNTEYDLALPLSSNEINDVISHINDQIKFKEESIVRSNNHIDYILKSDGTSLQEKLEAIELEEDNVVVEKQCIECLQYTKNFYTFLLNLNCPNMIRIYAGIDCYAPDGSDVSDDE